MLIYQVFDFLKKELNVHFRNSKSWKEDRVEIGNLSNTGKKEQSQGVTLTLISVSQETTLKNLNTSSSGAGNFERRSRPITFYIDFLASSSNNIYEESLKLISDVILFFQANTNFDHTTSPKLVNSIDRLSISIVDLDYHQLSNVWGMMGSAHLPGVVFRCRAITFDAGQTTEITPRISSGRMNDN